MQKCLNGNKIIFSIIFACCLSACGESESDVPVTNIADAIIPTTNNPYSDLPTANPTDTSNPEANAPDVSTEIKRTVSIEWADNSDNEDGFLIERRRTEELSFEVVKTLNQNSVVYSASVSLSDVTDYCYRVSAFNQAGSSASEEFCIYSPY